MKKLVIAFLSLFLLVSCDKLFIPGDVPDGPSALTLTSQAGERTAEPLSYTWEKTKTEVTTTKEGVDPFEAKYDPLVVQPGEEIRFTFADQNEPTFLNVSFYNADGEGGYQDMGMLDYVENDMFLITAPEEDGILVATAVWPIWVNSGINAEATYAFYIWSAKG